MSNDEVSTFKQMCAEMRKEMVRLLKNGLISENECHKVSEFFKLKEKDGVKVDLKNMAFYDIEQLVKRKNPKIHLGHAIEQIRLMNVKINDSYHYYNLLMKVSEREDCQVQIKRKAE
jgi:uncharacterized protein YqgQ